MNTLEFLTQAEEENFNGRDTYRVRLSQALQRVNSEINLNGYALMDAISMRSKHLETYKREIKRLKRWQTVLEKLWDKH